MNLTMFIITALAVWRLSSLFATESGPFNVFESIRSFIDWLCKLPGFQQSKLNEGIRCQWCNSIWFGVVLYGVLFLINMYKPAWSAYYLCFTVPLAVSTFAIGFRYWRDNQENNAKRNYYEYIKSKDAIKRDED